VSPSTGPHLFAVVNAQASGTDDEGQLATTLARLGNAGARAKGMATSSPEELEHALETTAGRRVVLVGGDGSLHAVANLSGELPEFALLPRGRANNVARALGIPVDRDAAARMAVQGEVALGALHPRLR
jgi:diacylglycerol kinase family enzyme